MRGAIKVEAPGPSGLWNVRVPNTQTLLTEAHDGAAATGAAGEAGAGGRGSPALGPELGGGALPLVVEVYGWVSLACSGTTRGMRNRVFDAVLLWTDRRGHGGALWAVGRAVWPDREPKWPAFPRGGRCSASRMRMPTTGSPGPCATPSQTGASASATRLCRSPSPHASNDADDDRAPPARAMSAGGWGGDSAAEHPR